MYQPLEAFSKSWIFKRNDPSVAIEDLTNIHLLTEKRAMEIWRDYISSEQIHPDHFSVNDWPKTEIENGHSVKTKWEARWDSEKDSLPEECMTHLANWDEETVVFFCCHNELIFEMSWGVFQRSWKAFLFLDNGPILVGKKKKQAMQFHSNGYVDLIRRVS